MVVGAPGYRIGNGPMDWMHQANNRRRRRGNSRHKPLCRVGLKVEVDVCRQLGGRESGESNVVVGKRLGG